MIRDLEEYRYAQSRIKSANLILDVGKPTFGRAYSTYLRTCANVHDYMVVSYPRSSNTAPRLLMSSRDDIPNLYQAVFYKQDPNRSIIMDSPEQGKTLALPALSDKHYSDIYRQSIYYSNGIIDKFGTAYWNNDVCYYVNYYRMDGEAPFSAQDREQLADASDLISNLVARHFASEERTSVPGAQISERNLGRIVRELSPESPLTEREAQVCTLIIMGCSSEAIALRFGIAVGSVMTYRRRAYARLSVVSQNELFALVFARSNASHYGWQ